MNPNSVTLTFHTDPGHGWVEYPYRDALLLGILPKISPYSYVREDSEGVFTLFLEEDFDAAVLIGALQSRGIEVKTTESYRAHTFVRSLRGFNLSWLQERAKEQA